MVGVPRSGTTWVQRMLAAHPAAFPLLETYMFSGRVGLGALFAPVPPDAGDDAPGAAPPGLGRLFTRGELLTETRAIARGWIARAVPADARFAVEKSPWHLHELPLIAEVLPEARFVNVLRDGRDVAVSLLEARRRWSQFGSSEPAEVLVDAARTWVTGCDLAAAAAPELGERLLEVRFEELRADPAAGCRALFDHCGMASTDAEVERAVASTDLERGDRSPDDWMTMRSGRVGEWRERFGIRDARRFERIAGATLAATGYESDPGWWRGQPLRSRL